MLWRQELVKVLNRRQELFSQERLPPFSLFLFHQVQADDGRTITTQTSKEVQPSRSGERCGSINCCDKMVLLSILLPMWLTGDLWFWPHPCKILGPKGGHRPPQLQEGCVASISVETRGSIVHYLFDLHLIGYMSLIIGTTLQEAGASKFFRTSRYHGEVNGPSIHRNVCCCC